MIGYSHLTNQRGHPHLNDWLRSIDEPDKGGTHLLAFAPLPVCTRLTLPPLLPRESNQRALPIHWGERHHFCRSFLPYAASCACKGEQ